MLKFLRAFVFFVFATVLICFLATIRQYNNWCQKCAARKMNYSSLTRTELTILIKKQKIALLNIKCSSTRPGETRIADAEIDIHMLTALSLTTTSSPSATHTDTPHGLMIRQQSLRDSVKDIKNFNPGNDIHHFITDLNQAYIITIREATVHIKIDIKRQHQRTVDTAISLVGALLMSEKIKTWTPNIYPHLVKTMNSHYTAGGIASEAQRYLDRGVKTDNTTEHNAIAYYNQPQRPEKSKDTPRQQITINKQLPQRKTHTNNTPPNNRSSYNRTHRHKAQSQAICRNYTRGFNCFHGCNWPYRHPPLAQVHLTTTEETLTSDAQIPTIDLDFPYGPGEK